jgi:molecular chaperone GrpE (heat shock protein)
MRLNNTSRQQDGIINDAEAAQTVLTDIIGVIENLDRQIDDEKELSDALRDKISNLEDQLSAANDRISELESK